MTAAGTTTNQLRINIQERLNQLPTPSLTLGSERAKNGRQYVRLTQHERNKRYNQHREANRLSPGVIFENENLQPLSQMTLPATATAAKTSYNKPFAEGFAFRVNSQPNRRGDFGQS